MEIMRLEITLSVSKNMNLKLDQLYIKAVWTSPNKWSNGLVEKADRPIKLFWYGIVEF